MTDGDHRPPLQLIAGVLGCVLPGLGHAYLGHVARGVLVAAGVLGLFAGGILIGGIDVIDRREDRWWFVLQAGVGPVAFVVDSVHQNWLKVPAGPERVGSRLGARVSALPDATQNPGGVAAPNTKSLGRVNEVGSLYTALAGMLNAIAVIDALWRRPARRADRRGAVAGGALQ